MFRAASLLSFESSRVVLRRGVLNRALAGLTIKGHRYIIHNEHAYI